MGAKSILISTDDVTYYALPGSQGEFSNEAGTLDDTIFGQNYKSTQTGIIGWSVKANGMYKGFAGYLATIKKAGTATAATGAPMTLVAGKTYKVSTSSHNLWDRTHIATTKIYDNGVDHTADVANIDWLFGQITFNSTYTVAGPVTADFYWLSTTQVAKAQEFTLTQTTNAIDTTVFEDAQANSGHREFIYGLQTVALDLTGVYALTNGYRASLEARSELIIEISPDGGGLTVFRGFFKPINNNQSGNVGALEKETNKFELSVPVTVPATSAPAEWYFDPATTLSTAVQKALQSWVGAQFVYVKYLSDGVAGIKGQAVLTDVTLKGGIEAMNDFTINFQGTGQITTV